MNLKNKDITEGMRVSNGKYELRVVSWDKSYNDCLLNYLDSKGNRYVVAQNYELSGTEKDPQISWMNGRYFTADSDDEALEEYLDYLGEVNEYDISESLNKSAKIMNEKVDSRYKYAFNHTKDEYEIVQFDDYNFEILAIPNDKSIFSDDLPKFKIEKTYIYDTCVNNKDITLFVGIVEELGWCFIAFDKLANNNNIFAYYISGKTKEGAYHSFHEYKSEYNLRCEESKKSASKSLKESAKSINEKNVAKFVDELNKFCDEKIHYVDMDAENFTKKYGKLYNFKYRFDDTDEIFIVYDSEGTLDMFDDNASYVREEIDRLAKKNGWYADPYTSSANFTFGEI